MRICDIVQLMQPLERLKISGLNQLDMFGQRIWTEALTDAQKYAYWEREVIRHYVNQEEMTVYCIVKEK